MIVLCSGEHRWLQAVVASFFVALALTPWFAARAGPNLVKS